MPSADYLVHFSNILMLLSYSVRDILWLRCFAVAAALTNIPYYLLQGTVLWPPVLWGSVFAAINLYQIARLYIERRPVVLSPEEQTLYDLAFGSLRPREFLSLVLAGEWRSATAGERVLTEGKEAAQICIPIAGAVEVRRRGESLGTLAPGSLIGTGVVLAGGPSPIDASFVAAARYIRWSLPGLRSFLDKRPDLRVALQKIANRDLARKIEQAVSA